LLGGDDSSTSLGNELDEPMDELSQGGGIEWDGIELCWKRKKIEVRSKRSG
jgi:hypothetical protein